MMTTLTLYLPLLLAWAQSPVGSNALFSLICFAGLYRVDARLCLLLTFCAHLALMVL